MATLSEYFNSESQRDSDLLDHIFEQPPPPPKRRARRGHTPPNYAPEPPMMEPATQQQEQVAKQQTVAASQQPSSGSCEDDEPKSRFHKIEHPLTGIDQPGLIAFVMCNYCLAATKRLQCIEFASEAKRINLHLCKACAGCSRSIQKTATRSFLFKPVIPRDNK